MTPKKPDTLLTQQQDGFLSLMFEQSHEGLLVVEIESLKWKANALFLSIFGLSSEGLDEEISRFSGKAKWEKSFPFSLKHVFSLPLKEEIELQILRSGPKITTARLFRNEYTDSDGNHFLFFSAKDISDQLATKTSKLSTSTGLSKTSEKPIDEYLRQIIDVDPNLIYVKNKERKVTMGNQSIATFFGCSITEFLENSTELFKTYKWKYEELEHVEDQIFVNHKAITTEEAMFNSETKKMHLFQFTRTPFINKSDEASILCVGVDITDRVNAENELITQREYLRHILDTDPSFIFVKDHVGKFILVNKAFADFYESSPESMIGKSDYELPWSKADRDTFMNSDRMVIESNETITLEEHTINPVTGKDVYFVTTKKPLLDVDGHLNILGVVTDITSQKIQEENLKKSEQMLQEIFDRVADALLILDFNTNAIIDCNQQAINMLKAESKESLTGIKLTEIQLKQDQKQDFWVNFLRQTSTINPTDEAEIYALDESRFWGSLAATRFEQQGRKLILLRISDITVQKESEEQIIQALHEKEILIQEIHHRVKNNMAVISSLLQLQTGYIKDPELINVFKDSQSRIKSMALIHEKLYQSKTLAKLEMDSYIKELTRTLLYTYNSRRVDIQINTFVDNVFLDINSAVPCGLIINELISNACKHAFQGRETGKIDIWFTKEGDVFNLVVQDNGVGLPPETDFSNFKSLGMNLVQALSSQLGAHLEILTENGLCFKISFVEKIKPNRDNIRN